MKFFSLSFFYLRFGYLMIKMDRSENSINAQDDCYLKLTNTASSMLGPSQSALTSNQESHVFCHLICHWLIWTNRQLIKNTLHKPQFSIQQNHPTAMYLKTELPGPELGLGFSDWETVVLQDHLNHHTEHRSPGLCAQSTTVYTENERSVPLTEWFGEH